MWLALAFLMVFIVVDLVENFDKYIDKNASLEDIVLFYVYFLPWIFVIVSPVGILLSANFTGNSLARTNEVVACKSVGISSLRFGKWVYIFAFFWSLFILVFGEMVVPPASAKSDYIKDYKIYKRKKRTKIKRDIHVLGEKGETYSIKSYNPANQTAFDVAIVFFDDSTRIQKRIDARSMRWVDNHFELNNVYIRTFKADSEYTEFKPKQKLQANEKPEDFLVTRVDPDKMGFYKLLKFIQKQKRMGRNPIKEQTELYVKISFPFANLIILLFSLPIALHMRKSGAAIAFGISFIVAFLYFSLVRIGQSLGYNETLSPLMAANLGNIVFGLLGLGILIRFRD